MARKIILCVLAIVVVGLCAYGLSIQKRLIILNNDNTNPVRNFLLKQDVKYFAKELPKRHKNLYAILPKQEFTAMCAELTANVENLNNLEVFTGLSRILGAVGDSHTSIDYFNGYRYPLTLQIFGDDVYVINADKSLEDMMNARIVRINGHEISEVLEKLSELIPHENESWLKAYLPGYLNKPMYLHGLGLIDNEDITTFTVERDGSIFDTEVKILAFGQTPDLIKTAVSNPMAGQYVENYAYKHIPEQNAIYFEYNACADDPAKPFSSFNEGMFKVIEDRDVKRIIVDLRSNSGGNSEILNPFTDRLKEYAQKNPDLKVFVLIGRNTFSSGMFAILRILQAVPEAIYVGEPTGGALASYGEVKTFTLPSLRLTVRYSIKYFDLNKMFEYEATDLTTFRPSISLEPSFEDYINGNDVVLNYALN